MFLGGGGGVGGFGWYPWSEFQNLSFCVSRRKPFLFRYFSIVLICAFPSCCRSFSPSLCYLSPFLLSCVAVSRPCRLSVFYPYWTCTPTLYNFLFCSLTWLLIHLHAGYLIPQSLEEQAPLQSNTLTLSMDFPTSFGDGVEKMMTSTTGTYICATTVLLISMSPAYFSVTDLFCNMKMMWSSEIQIFRRR